MGDVSIDFARESDDAELRQIVRELPMPGMVRISYLREPSFFKALSVEGRENHVIVGRDIHSGRIVGLGTYSVKPAFVNGHRRALGYLSSLRGKKDYRGGWGMFRGFRLFKRLSANGPVSLSLTTILESNQRARNLLTSGRLGLPAYHDLGRFCSLAIGIHQLRKRDRQRTNGVREATKEDLSRLIDFWHREGKKKQFFPCYALDDLMTDNGLLKGIKSEDVLIAEKKGDIVGTVALWDQKSFRQSLVEDYAPWFIPMRLAYNCVGRILGYPVLPRRSSILDYSYLSVVCIRGNEPDVFSSLFSRAMERCRSKYNFLMAGFHERDPLLSVVKGYRHFTYTSRLYAVVWNRGKKMVSELDDRIPYLELGAL